MDKIDIAQDLLERIGMPTAQQSTLCCLTLLAMANVKKDGTFQNATNDWIRIHDVISFIDKEYFRVSTKTLCCNLSILIL